jgi:AcrR family transcriptional regulator
MGLTAEQERMVLDGAVSLATTQKLSSITLDQLAKASGVGSWDIARHYKSKERILEAVLDRELELISGSVPPPELRFSGESLRDEIETIARSMLEQYRSRLPFMAKVLTEAMKNDEVGDMFYRKFIVRGRVLFADFLKARQERGEIRAGVDVEAAAAIYLAALTSVFLVSEVVGGKRVEPLDEGRLVASLGDVFLNGVSRS